ncbi:DUF1559 domain-containing protein [Gimesia chilikensis]|uniref:DUF1559 family PulG-like putative transporter n=1 Tax=Gimesia chilikensis TaxID=2605989 RepID=UPI0011EC2C0A|nr:DUF1559 domain-containing protein [Gimesia chilikensis]KAA0134815.1 DUF1559 domain-containing protein [Gimesia chilikensis]
MQENSATSTTETQPLTTLQRFWVALAGGLMLLGLTLGLGLFFLPQTVYALMIGWISYLWRVVPTLTLSISGTLWFLCTLSLFLIGVHLAGRKLYRGTPTTVNRTESTKGVSRWRLRWTVTLVSLLLVLITCGISLIGISHQLWWMAAGDQRALLRERPLSLFYPVAFIEGQRRRVSIYHLKTIGFALHNYYDEHHQFPIGATVDATGKPQHGWTVQILPYLDERDLFQQIDFNQPWTAEENRQVFETRLPVLENPGLNYDFEPGDIQQTDRSGYRPAHYAANQRLLGLNGGLRIRDIKDGTSHTIMGGEVKAGIRAWGNPLNIRDPARGINQGPETFAGPFGPGANVLFADGGVRFLSEDIDPAVLKALSTPDGREVLEEIPSPSGNTKGGQHEY